MSVSIALGTRREQPRSTLASVPPQNHAMQQATARPTLTRPALTILCATILVSVASASMTTVALPDLQRDFDVSDDDLTWVVTAYLITFATGTVGYGRLADMHGTRPLYLFGLALFTIASFLVALAPGYWWVVGARALQGVGGTAVPALSMATIVRTTDPARRGGPMGATVLTVGIGFGIGPLLGGSLTEWWGWEAPFVATGLASVLLFVAAIGLVPSVPGRPGQSFDFAGSVLLTAAVTGLLIALNRLPRDASDAAGLGGLIAAVPLVALLTWRIRAAAEPYVSPRVLRNARFLALAVVGFGAQGTHFATVVLFPLLLARYHDQSIIEIGLWMLPGACALALTGIGGGLLSVRFGNRSLITCGTLVMAAGAVTLHLAGVGWDPAGISAIYVVIAAGYGLTNGPVLSSSTAELPPDLAGVGVGVYNLVFFLGGAVAVALTGAILRSRAGAGEALNPLFTGHAPEFSDAAIVVVATACVALLLALSLVASRPRTQSPLLGADETLEWRLKPRPKPNAEP